MITKYRLRLTTPAEAHLPAYDYTKLSAYNTCPTYATLRYTMHKRMPGASRAMALEAGQVMHECFSAVRLWQLKHVDGYPELADKRFAELFKEPARREVMNAKQTASNLSDRQRLIHFCVQCLHTSGYYDDPGDAKRTLPNMEQALVYYIDRWNLERYPVFVASDRGFVGIELAFDLILEYEEAKEITGELAWNKLRFIGRTDGLHTDNGVPILQENKTAWRLDDQWRNSFDMSHQVTGYLGAGTALAGLTETIDRAIVLGCTIPLPRDIMKGIDYVHVSRAPHMFVRWVNWFVNTHRMRLRTFDNPTLADKYTHSCNRFFRTCEFLPFCVSDDQEQRDMLAEFETDEWSPLHGEVEKVE